ncbi:hypothetical protein BC939DRAFT_440763 [Gamsiella multidivaricata]|uniref:uncharacterized protein n=1 Tax=Gamsiella multidivaricata TaxID=101098 RepID=UPI00221EC4D4|nr:uncharacterized protein BC939DRAFT_440763 [Gamsiella multidivaricata]KAG0359169.1 hypothetical protein BGZ54_010082 [Gamsiella multidivaricata]KAI7829829.1 hypothetical protein BC939DRAFT_440763 [Gamsiella multidivaricata]
MIPFQTGSPGSLSPLPSSQPLPSPSYPQSPCKPKNSIDTANHTAVGVAEKSSLRQQQQRQQIQWIHTLNKRLDILIAGSLFLAQTALVYNISAMVAVQPRLDDPSTTTSSVRGSNGEDNYAWKSWQDFDDHYTMSNPDGVMTTVPFWLAAFGIILPIVTVKVLARIERTRACKGSLAEISGETQCPYERMKRRIAARLWKCRKGGNTGRVQPPGYCRSRLSRCRSLLVTRPKILVLVSLMVYTLSMFLASNTGLSRKVAFPLAEGNMSDVDLQSVLWTSQRQQLVPEIMEGSQFINMEEGYAGSDIDSSDKYSTMTWDDVSPEKLEAMVRAADDDEVMDTEWGEVPASYPTQSQQDHAGVKDSGETIGDSNESAEKEKLSALSDFWDTAEQAVDKDGGVSSGFVGSDISSSSSEMPPPLPCTVRDRPYNDYDLYASNYTAIYTFEYVPGWTEAIVLLIALCSGSAMAGFYLARHNVRELVSELQKDLGEDGDDSENKKMVRRLGYRWTRFLPILVILSQLHWGCNADLTTPPMLSACISAVLVVVVREWMPENLDRSFAASASVPAAATVAGVQYHDEQMLPPSACISMPPADEKDDEKLARYNEC